MKLAIEGATEALQCLKEGVVLLINQEGRMIFFGWNSKRVSIHCDGCSYRLSEKDFIELFKEETFYWIERSEEMTINPEKDEEYYRWRHK